MVNSILWGKIRNQADHWLILLGCSIVLKYDAKDSDCAGDSSAWPGPNGVHRQLNLVERARVAFNLTAGELACVAPKTGVYENGIVVCFA